MMESVPYPRQKRRVWARSVNSPIAYQTEDISRGTMVRLKPPHRMRSMKNWTIATPEQVELYIRWAAKGAEHRSQEAWVQWCGEVLRAASTAANVARCGLRRRNKALAN